MADPGEATVSGELRLPNELWHIILYELVNDAQSLRSAALSCNKLLQAVTQQKRLALAALVGQRLVRLAALNIAASKIDKDNRAAVDQLLRDYLIDKHLDVHKLPTADEVRPLHRAVCYFTDAFFREAWWAFPLNALPVFLNPPTVCELRRVRRAFYLQEFIMRFLDGRQLEVVQRPVCFLGPLHPSRYRGEFRYPELGIFHNVDFIIGAVLLKFLCGALDQSKYLGSDLRFRVLDPLKCFLS